MCNTSDPFCAHQQPLCQVFATLLLMIVGQSSEAGGPFSDHAAFRSIATNLPTTLAGRPASPSKRMLVGMAPHRDESRAHLFAMHGSILRALLSSSSPGIKCSYRGAAEQPHLGGSLSCSPWSRYLSPLWRPLRVRRMSLCPVQYGKIRAGTPFRLTELVC